MHVSVHSNIPTPMLPELYNTTRKDIPEDTLTGIVEGVVSGEGYGIESLILVYCGSTMSRRINNEFLGHDYPTDTITFRYDEGRLIDGEVYICLDIVNENAERYGVDSLNELMRVTAHSALHLVGYTDATEEEREVMRSREDYYLQKFSPGAH
jgi:probable rRNA maturation factor